MKLSLVVPCYNEENNLRAFYKQVLTTMKDVSFDYEIIFINDGRIDGDLQLNEYSKEDIEQRRVCVYNFLQERGW